MKTTPTETTTTLGLAAWISYASGIVAAVGLVFLIAMFASFAAGATSPGLVFGWINDVLGVVGAMFMLPLAVALHVLLRPRAPILSGLAMMIGVGAMVGIIVLQSLLVVGALTFKGGDRASPDRLPLPRRLARADGLLGNSTGALPHGLRMGLLAVTYVGYPIWAFWLGRHLLQEIREPVASPAAGAERYLATGR